MLGLYDANRDGFVDKAEFLQFWMYALAQAGGIYYDADFQRAWDELTYQSSLEPPTDYV